MSSVREHLKAFHTDHADFHAKMGKAHKAAMENYEDGSPEHSFHKTAMEIHASAGEQQIAAAKQCMKAMPDSFGKGDGLERVSAIHDPAPPRGRLVPRTGQREISEAQVDSAFETFVKVDDD